MVNFVSLFSLIGIFPPFFSPLLFIYSLFLSVFFTSFSFTSLFRLFFQFSFISRLFLFPFCSLLVPVRLFSPCYSFIIFLCVFPSYAFIFRPSTLPPFHLYDFLLEFSLSHADLHLGTSLEYNGDFFLPCSALSQLILFSFEPIVPIRLNLEFDYNKSYFNSLVSLIAINRILSHDSSRFPLSSERCLVTYSVPMFNFTRHFNRVHSLLSHLHESHVFRTPVIVALPKRPVNYMQSISLFNVTAAPFLASRRNNR